MLESPLWLREKEDIPVFQILPLNSKSVQCGDEIDVVGIKFSPNVDADDNDDRKKSMECNATKQMERNATCNLTSSEKEDLCNSYLLNDVTTGKDGKAEEISVNMQRLLNHETHSSELCNQESENCDLEELTNCESNCNNNIQQVDVNLENLEIEIAGQSENVLHLHKHNKDTENKSINVNMCNNDEALQLQSVEISDNDENEERLQPQLEINNSPDDGKMIQSQLDKICNNTSSATMCGEQRKVQETDRINKRKETDSAETQNVYHELTMHVEQSVKEWITKNTLCLLIGEADEKNELLEKLTQYDKYQQLCKKLNKLQVQDEKEDRVDLERNKLKLLPYLAVLQEDGKKMQLKVQ